MFDSLNYSPSFFPTTIKYDHFMHRYVNQTSQFMDFYQSEKSTRLDHCSNH